MITPASDRLLEDIYDLINRQHGEPMRLEVARTALLAAEYRANKLKQQRLQAAIDRRAAERRELKASTGAGLVSSSAVSHTSDNLAGRLSPARPGVEREAQ